MADAGDSGDPMTGAHPTDSQRKEIAAWFLTRAPAGEIAYVAKDVKALLGDDKIYEAAAEEAYPAYNKAHLVPVDLPGQSDNVIISPYGEIDKNHYLEPRTSQVATVDHIKQRCTISRPATDEELPSAFVEEFRTALDAELCKYVQEAYPNGTCAVYCTTGKHVDGPGSDFGFVMVISASRHRPQNFCNGSWRSVWTVEFKEDLQLVELKGKLQVGAHYFEEGNVQLKAENSCKDSTLFQPPDECALTVTGIVRHHESEFLASLETSYLNLSDATFKDLRRKLPITRTLFPWHNTKQFSLAKDLSRELGIK